MRSLDDDALWAAVLSRDASYDGVFYYGVTTTGVYCRPQCPGRKPKRENAVFAFSPAALERAGFRPCRRCRPDEARVAHAAA
jgi:AraC family transcriptional regulator of adaptative response/methylated-DNA-[protein]-cysteine methyltransferase